MALELAYGGFDEADEAPMFGDASFALLDEAAEELAAIYQFIRYLGPKGRPAPQALPPE